MENKQHPHIENEHNLSALYAWRGQLFIHLEQAEKSNFIYYYGPEAQVHAIEYLRKSIDMVDASIKAQLDRCKVTRLLYEE